MDSNHTCLAPVGLDSAPRKDENYYPQVFLKEYKYIEKKIIRHINDNLTNFAYSDKSDEEWSRISSFLKKCSTLFVKERMYTKKHVVFF